MTLGSLRPYWYYCADLLLSCCWFYDIFFSTFHMYVLSNKVYLCICAKCIMKFKPRLLHLNENRQMQTRKNKNKQTNKTGALMHHNCARNKKMSFPWFSHRARSRSETLVTRYKGIVLLHNSSYIAITDFGNVKNLMQIFWKKKLLCLVSVQLNCALKRVQC